VPFGVGVAGERLVDVHDPASLHKAHGCRQGDTRIVFVELCYNIVNAYEMRPLHGKTATYFFQMTAIYDIMSSYIMMEAIMAERAKKAPGIADYRLSLRKRKVTFLDEIDRIIN